MLETTHSLPSAHLGYDKSLWILRRNGAAPATRLLVFTDAEIYLQRVGARDVLRPFIDESMEEVCAVFVSHGTEDQRYAESLFNPQFSAFLAGELPAFLRSAGLVTPSTASALCGLSLTGLATVVAALDHPGVYGKIGAQSGAYWPEEGRILRELDRLPRHGAPSFYFDVGSEETDREGEVMSQVEGVEAVRTKLESLGCSVTTHIFQGGHSTRGWKAALPIYLKWALSE